ncbi:hypothetical protein SAMD00019534_105660 [Acytostelium subglobosum LB1]|uniref:hypothetical protein n=1 Tax=Acytostelium subglobosum LB1 TaxID=1410327 RepID=UPI000644ED1F|nr:hypothetical protein SAMD00019534_105660 [Acytostelium subglobosum LB1]GAM27391.1 hypothetical protein SAMD00019534_105660 [Acytostelium subglobosum LB1]|eukprot:XP_012749858.1 hypothetical protein SAMD00019534_105660 [Acytostelium subglobosum LB1]
MSQQQQQQTEVVRLYHKQALSLDDAKLLYASEEIPGQTVPVIIPVEKENEVESLANGKHLAILLEQDQAKIRDVQQPADQFNTNRYFDKLDSVLFGHHLLFAPLLSSTQTIMMSQLTFTGQGIVMVADRQTNARGRGSNPWTSPPGCLVFSFKCKQEDGTKLPFLQYLVGIAMIRAIDAPELGVRLKWPNDIYAADGKKVGGILCQSNHLNGKFDVVVGVGLNVENEQPTVSLNQLGSVRFNRDELLARFFTEFESMYIMFTRQGFIPFAAEYMSAWLHTDQIVRLEESNSMVKIVGLSPSGFLQAAECNESGVIKPNQHTFELHPDGTSFDLAHLTIKKKN